jgi:hypothetical protein
MISLLACKSREKLLNTGEEQVGLAFNSLKEKTIKISDLKRIKEISSQQLIKRLNLIWKNALTIV